LVITLLVLVGFAVAAKRGSAKGTRTSFEDLL
jgi:hypothetical protein